MNGARTRPISRGTVPDVTSPWISRMEHGIERTTREALKRDFGDFTAAGETREDTTREWEPTVIGS